MRARVLGAHAHATAHEWKSEDCASWFSSPTVGVPGLSSGHQASQKAPLPNVPMIFFFNGNSYTILQIDGLPVLWTTTLKGASSVSYFVSTASQNWIHFSSVVIDKRGGREGC